MKTLCRLSVALWARSAIYFFLLALAITFLFMPGLDLATAHERVPNAILLMIVSVAVCYLLTAIFLKGTPREIFPLCPAWTFTETLRDLPKLIGVFAIFAFVFAVISGLLSLLLYYVFFTGVPQAERKTPLLIGVAIFVILSSPFFTGTYARFAGGENRFRPLLSGSIRMGRRLYGKYLVLGAIAFGLAVLIRILLGGLSEPAGLLLMPALTGAVFGVCLPVSWIMQEDEVKRASRIHG